MKKRGRRAVADRRTTDDGRSTDDGQSTGEEPDQGSDAGGVVTPGGASGGESTPRDAARRDAKRERGVTTEDRNRAAKVEEANGRKVFDTEVLSAILLDKFGRVLGPADCAALVAEFRAANEAASFPTLEIAQRLMGSFSMVSGGSSVAAPSRS